MIDRSLTTHNFQPTFFRPGVSPSCIDHLYSNALSKINDITTYSPSYTKYNNKLFTLKLDHAILSAVYSHKDIKLQPKFHKFRDQKLINKATLSEKFSFE